MMWISFLYILITHPREIDLHGTILKYDVIENNTISNSNANYTSNANYQTIKINNWLPITYMYNMYIISAVIIQMSLHYSKWSRFWDILWRILITNSYHSPHF